MLDPQIPPAAEGEADGGVDAVPRIGVGPAVVVTASSRAASTPPRWTTTTEPAWAATKAPEAADDPALGRRMLRRNPSRCLPVTTPLLASLRSSMTCSFRQRSRRQ